VTKQIADTHIDKVMQYSRDNMPEITPQQDRFVREYLIDLNQRQAAIRAGYPISNADNTASRLMSDAKVSSHIQAALAERNKRTGLNADLVDIELARILRVNPTNVIDMQTGEIKPDATEDDLAAIQSVKVKRTPCKGGGYITENEVRFVSKDKALELAMKRHDMLIERKQVDIRQQIETMTSEERDRRIKELLAKREAIDITPEE
jgi:phage terminase small subunit